MGKLLFCLPQRLASQPTLVGLPFDVEDDEPPTGLMFRVNLYVVFLNNKTTILCGYDATSRCQHSNRNGLFGGDFSRLLARFIFIFCAFIAHFLSARICTRVFCTAKLFVAPEGLIFAAKSDHHLHCQVMMVGIVKH